MSFTFARVAVRSVTHNIPANHIAPKVAPKGVLNLTKTTRFLTSRTNSPDLIDIRSKVTQTVYREFVKPAVPPRPHHIRNKSAPSRPYLSQDTAAKLKQHAVEVSGKLFGIPDSLKQQYQVLKALDPVKKACFQKGFKTYLEAASAGLQKKDSFFNPGKLMKKPFVTGLEGIEQGNENSDEGIRLSSAPKLMTQDAIDALKNACKDNLDQMRKVRDDMIKARKVVLVENPQQYQLVQDNPLFSLFC